LIRSLVPRRHVGEIRGSPSIFLNNRTNILTAVYCDQQEQSTPRQTPFESAFRNNFVVTLQFCENRPPDVVLIVLEHRLPEPQLALSEPNRDYPDLTKDRT
jgi:hypothetical protein